MPKIRKNIAISESGFVFDPLSGESYSLNPLGLEIIHLIKNGQTYEELSEVLLAKYEVDQETLDRYFYDFIATLKQFNLLEVETDA
ncbi:HPr-rel-A system PqqD family peptide chaperone [Cyclobacterium jeungdonense]|uniref:HPr-rel-A system PqqD family peptide chaperone n=1 Tax=Cyclobacterium jeungdonense TaxID=708087 RepID=A0ABT8C6Q5_9BACT|nr:HPr-rel-A system PqqD family peptide chaperone [Cyclobacterium jeungdonense]MDN3687747.1 HPr-rel-A system PqqD family peptide chaperone [Cyclobacterium jeungdonense]